jgi:hypothetical protein
MSETVKVRVWAKTSRGEVRNLRSPRIKHRGHLVNGRGGVSALCFKRPRAIDMSRATWVGRDDTVTCRKCLAIIGERSRRSEEGR